MAEAELATLKRKRSQVKQKLSRFQKYVESTEKSISELKVRLNKVEPLLEEFEEIQAQIELKEDSENPELIEEFETNYFSLITKATEFINLNKGTTITTTDHQVNNLAKLPRITVPTFHGGYEYFRSFYETFNSLIHNRQDLDDIQKFCYLKSSLKGEALQVIGALEITAENYPKAWDLIKDRYDNKRLVIARHFKAIFESEKIEKESSVKLRGMLDNIQRHLRALESLQLPVQHWDAPLIYYLSQRLDSKTLREWETKCEKDVVPTLKQFLDFLQSQAIVLETLESEKGNKGQRSHTSTSRQTSHAATIGAQPSGESQKNNNDCPICKRPHKIYSCRLFLSSNVKDRIQSVTKAKLCTNCLKRNHTAEQCKKGACRKCSNKHNTLLHPQEGNGSEALPQTNPHPLPPIEAPENQIVSNTAAQDQRSTIMLATAVVLVLDANYQAHQCRILLDSGSQINCITERIAQLLKVPFSKKTTTVHGIGGSRTAGSKSAQYTITSLDRKFTYHLDCIIMPKITLDFPSYNIDVSKWSIPSHTTLADPGFFKRASIDMLIGAAEFYNIIDNGQIPLGTGLPTLQCTKFGWVMTGQIQPHRNSTQSDDYAEIGCLVSLEECLGKFWALEEVAPQHKLNPEELACETNFINTTKRDRTGRFEVHLPIKSGISEMGETQDTALKRFMALERKLEKTSRTREAYTSFMKEYRELGHMELVAEPEESGLIYYMPHHCVTNEYSSTTKLRVVFDASCKSSSGTSLNDYLMAGPVLQEDLVSIIIRFRKHQFVMTADITKMYRQVNICPQHRSLQRILWRDSPNETIQVYNLNTVTYGTKPASFLSTRCLKELSTLFRESHPIGSFALEHDFYVDDLLSGSNSIQEALILQQQIIHILGSGQFHLHKWCSNDPRLLESIPPDKRETKYELNMENLSAIKTLGVWWNPATDVFKYSIHIRSGNIFTKRSILAEIAKIFDPLGLLGPVILKAKLFMRKLWSLNIQWDEPLEEELLQEWLQFRNELKKLEQIDIPRCVMKDSNIQIEIHGFADASEQAYGASVYIRSHSSNSFINVSLLCSKSRVAPMKGLTIPRLELCAALLLSRLITKCIDALKLESFTCHLWTDSMVTLAWISQPSGNWKTFVSNRVSEIYEHTKNHQWHFIKGTDNPSDMLSRGFMPNQIIDSSLWWNGPSWLSQPKETWPQQPVIMADAPEEKKCVSLTATTSDRVIIFERFSSFNKLIRTIAYVLRFIKYHTRSNYDTSGPISTVEREEAICECIKIVQREAFTKELKLLRKHKQLTGTSSLQNLNPFLGEDNVIRVGGRLQHSSLEYQQRHQIVLPYSHKFTELLIEYYHKKHLHAGPQLLLATIRQRYWPIKGKDLVRKTFHRCKVCFRHQPKSMVQLMGDLPAERVQPSKPFSNTGVDFCGPVLIKSGTTRNAKPVKAYISLFICLCSKAVHIELVGDLGTNSFISALKRFFARRGKSRKMFSDNGKNFVGAERELNKYIGKSLQDTSLTNFTAEEGIIWSFTPPRAPHFGGLWESAIKSLKYHLKRVIGNALLTFEEMTTYLTMIEACLNSRPLLPISNDPSDLSILTPGHFLTGDALNAIAEPDLTPYEGKSLTRWRRVQQMYQHFWQRWSLEYLSSLQSRKKWLKQKPNLQVNKLVLIKEDNLPPMKWLLGRVLSTHPGKDGCIRVATVKTANGILKRPISKLCPLPDSEDHQK